MSMDLCLGMSMSMDLCLCLGIGIRKQTPSLDLDLGVYRTCVLFVVELVVGIGVDKRIQSKPRI